MKRQIARRSAVGITYKNQVILVNTEDTDAYAQDLARIFWLSEDEGGLGCRDAMTLDGGPSAQMFVEYKSLKIDIPGGWGVPNGLGVFKTIAGLLTPRSEGSLDEMVETRAKEIRRKGRGGRSLFSFSSSSPCSWRERPQLFILPSFSTFPG